MIIDIYMRDGIYSFWGYAGSEPFAKVIVTTGPDDRIDYECNVFRRGAESTQTLTPAAVLIRAKSRWPGFAFESTMDGGPPVIPRETPGIPGPPMPKLKPPPARPAPVVAEGPPQPKRKPRKKKEKSS